MAGQRTLHRISGDLLPELYDGCGGRREALTVALASTAMCGQGCERIRRMTLVGSPGLASVR